MIFVNSKFVSSGAATEKPKTVLDSSIKIFVRTQNLGIDQYDNVSSVIKLRKVIYCFTEKGTVRCLQNNKFIGTITPQEAKFSIYKDSLGFEDFANFDGVRFAYRGVPVVVFRLKNFIKTDTFQLFTEHKTAGRLFSIPLMYDPLLWKRFLILKKMFKPQNKQ